MNYISQVDLSERDNNYRPQEYDEISRSSDSISSSDSQKYIGHVDEDEYSGSIDSSSSSDSKGSIIHSDETNIEPLGQSDLLKLEAKTLERLKFQKILEDSSEKEANKKVFSIEDSLSLLNSSLEADFRFEQKPYTVFYGQIVIEPGQVFIEQSTKSPHESENEIDKEIMNERSKWYVPESIYLDHYADPYTDTYVDPYVEPNLADFYDISSTQIQGKLEIGKMNQKEYQIEEGAIDSYQQEIADEANAPKSNIHEIGEKSTETPKDQEKVVFNRNTERFNELGVSDYSRNIAEGTSDIFGNNLILGGAHPADNPEVPLIDSLRIKIKGYQKEKQYTKSIKGETSCAKCKIF